MLILERSAYYRICLRRFLNADNIFVMKKLLLIRHAKSDWDDLELQDIDRPLNKRGLRNAPVMAARLKEQNIIPDLIVSSPARRAIATADFFAEGLHLDKTAVVVEQDAYLGSAGSLLSIINMFDNKYNFIALVGHNPALTNLAINLCNLDTDNIPTCGYVLITFPFDDWSLISSWTGDKKIYDYPKNIYEAS